LRACRIPGLAQALSALKAVFMIESSMYFGIGFLLAVLSVLVVAPLVHGRAVRLTTRRLEATIPLSMAEVHADKDLLRAEFAMSTRRLETNVEQLKTKSASQLAEIGRKGDAINRLKIELGTLRDQLYVTEKEYAVKATAVQEAERALTDKESELAKLMGELDERSTRAEAQKIEIIALKTQVEAMKIRLDGAGNELKAVEDRRAADRALSEKESQLAKLMGELDERSSLAEAQKTEIIALKTQVEAMKIRLDGASNELKAVEDRRDAERIELKAAAEKLVEERGKFENFHRRVAELVQQLMTQSSEDKILGRRAQELEKRLVVQSRLLNERESELEHLRGEIEIARKAEADLRIAMIEIDGRENVATQNLKAEKAKLQAALDRANGERMRLAYELANMRRQAEEPWAAERVEKSMPRERISDVAAGGAGRVAYGRLPRRANSGPLTLVTSHEDRGVH
jgi:chromosome segregation ATPase